MSLIETIDRYSILLDVSKASVEELLNLTSKFCHDLSYLNIPNEKDLVNLFRILVHVSISGYLSVNSKVCLAFEDISYDKSVKQMYGLKRSQWHRLMKNFKVLLHLKVYKEKYSNSLWKGKPHLLKPEVDCEIGEALKWIMFEKMSCGKVTVIDNSKFGVRNNSVRHVLSLKRIAEERKKHEKNNSVLRKAYLLKDEAQEELKQYTPWLAYAPVRIDISVKLAHLMMEIPLGVTLRHVDTVEKHFLPNVDFIRITAPIRKAKKRERMLAEKERIRQRNLERDFQQRLKEEDENDLMKKEDFDVLVEDDDPKVVEEKRRIARDIEGAELKKHILPLWKKKKLRKRMKFMPSWYKFHKELDRRVTEKAISNAEKRKSKKLNKSRAKDELGLNYSYSNFTEDWALRFIELGTFEEKLALIKEYGKFCYANATDMRIGTAWSQSYMVFKD
jgi:hypothetical protein